MKGMVFLVGAGPGDPGLLTLRGYNALKQADVVVYDHLASPSLLAIAPTSTVWIDAGKTAGHHHMKQEDTNMLLVRLAGEGKTVVRLKGGDPFIFGRGGEEALALAEAGIEYQIIPGISSSYAAAAYAGIPVTHRHIASSFHVITGHEHPQKEHEVLDYQVLAREEGTLVFLMGLGRLESISKALIDNGMSEMTKVAVISSGTTSRQRVAIGTLTTIAQVVKDKDIRPPAIIVVGEVTSFSKGLDWKKKEKLTGKRILITATDTVNRRLSEKIDQLGGEAVCMSLIDIKPCDELQLAPLLLEKKPGSWLVFTSRNGVNVFFDKMKKEKLDHRCLHNSKIAVLGTGTANALSEYGYYADLIPNAATSMDLAEELKKVIAEDELSTGQRSEVWMFRAREGSKQMRMALEQESISCRDIALYDTIYLTQRRQVLQQVMKDVDYVVFCSASGVNAFSEMVDNNTINYKTLCIGPITAQTAERNCLKVDYQAKEYTLDGLIDALCQMASDDERK